MAAGVADGAGRSDLTDAMYDPADPPYVDHADGTQLVISYIAARPSVREMSSKETLGACSQRSAGSDRLCSRAP